MSGISTHILDLTRGGPAASIAVALLRREENAWREISTGQTDQDGRIKELLPEGASLRVGLYRLRVETGSYFRSLNEESFHPYIEITVQIQNAGKHYHVPLLVTPFSYSTYRGS